MSSLHGAGHVDEVVLAFFTLWMWTKASRGRVVEQTFGWMTRRRRLVRDYEQP